MGHLCYQVNIYEGIDSTLLILQSRLHENPSQENSKFTHIKVIKQYEELPLIECYPRQINQVFMNIISNAIDELQALETKPDKHIIIKTEMSGCNQIEIKIRDNALGISPNIKNKIFDPFFTTKPVGKGTGLGLSICYQILQKHGGTLEVISEPGEGAEFVISLPIKSSY